MYGGGSFVAMPSAYGAASYGGAGSYMGGNVFGTQALGTTGFGTFGTSGTTTTTTAPMTTTAYGGYPSYGTSMGGGMNYGNPLFDHLPMGYAGVGQSTAPTKPAAAKTTRGVKA